MFLRSTRTKHNRRLEEAINAIREVIADGQLNASDDWQDWNDNLVFREEQRAIGAMMIAATGPVRTIMGYGEFSELLRTKTPPYQYRWVQVAARFFLDIAPKEKDFRTVRIKALYVHLVDFIAALDGSRLRPSHREKRAQLYAELPAVARHRLTFTEKDERVVWTFSRQQSGSTPTSAKDNDSA